MNRAIIGAVGHARKVLRLVSSKTGQATVEYLIVGLVLLAMVLALGVLANRLGDGLFVEHAAESASHSLGPNTMGAIGDVLLY